MPVPLGTIAAMCGLSVFNFKKYDQSILELHVGAAWTRVYTQVWSETWKEWQYGAMVEYADITSYVTGTLYNGIRWVNLTQSPSNDTIYSKYFHDPNWRKQTAIQGHHSGQMIQDRTGSITFKFDEPGFVNGCTVAPHWINTTSSAPSHSDYETTKLYLHLAQEAKMLNYDIYKLDSVFFKSVY